MNDFTCRVRTFVHLDSNGRIIESDDVTGHYDLLILNSGNGPLTFDCHEISNPCFSYGGKNNQSGRINIFPENKTYEFYHDRPFAKMYTFDFVASSDSVLSLRSTIISDVNRSTEVEDNGMYKYTVTSGMFETYTKAYINCFASVAKMCDLLGYSTLWNIYENHSDDSDDYKYYLAWKMYDRYGANWLSGGYYGTPSYTALDMTDDSEI